MLRRIADGGFSLICAVLAAIVGGGPVWMSHLAISAGLVPSWAYVVVLALALSVLLLVVDFIRKGLRGVSPTRSRPR